MAKQGNADIYGLSKESNKALLTSHDSATQLVLGKNPLRMVQQAQLQYNQRTEARFEVGFENIYWACGQSQGTLTLNKLICQSDAAGKKGGMWNGMENAMTAGHQASNGKANEKWSMKTENGTASGDGVMQQASMGFNVGDMAIQDNAVLSVGMCYSDKKKGK